MGFWGWSFASIRKAAKFDFMRQRFEIFALCALDILDRVFSYYYIFYYYCVRPFLFSIAEILKEKDI